MNWGDIFTTLTSTALVLGVLGYVAKKAVETWLAHRLEAHKNSLDRASETALEKLRYELRIAEAQQSRLLARQASIIAEVFARVERLHQAIVTLAKPIEHEGGKAKALRDEAATRFYEFEGYYYERAIWLDVDTNTKLNELAMLLRKLLNDLHFNLGPDGEVMDRTKWVETMTRLQKEVPDARGELDRQFRKLLGVVTPGTLPTAPHMTA